MKKHLGVKIAALMLIVFFAFIYGVFTAFAEDAAYEDNISYEMQLPNALGITNTYLMSQEKVTRADFVECALRFVNMHPDETGYYETASFFDVPQSSSFSAAVEVISSLNIMNGDDGFFYPNRIITINEAVTVMIRLLGYEDEAAARGGYPTGYYSLAAGIGVLDRVSKTMEQEASGADICRIIYNCLTIRRPEMRLYNNGASISIPGGTAMEKIFDVYKLNGVVDANSFTSLTGESKLRDSQVSIDGRIFNIGTTEAGELLGHHIYFYYRYDKEIDEDVILTVNDSRNRSFTINAEQIEEFSNNTYWYYDESGKLKKAAVSAQADVIYNGKAITADFSEWKPRYGNVLLIDRDRNGTYDCIQITSYRIVVVSAIDKEKELIYDRCDRDNPIDMNKYSKVRISDQNGYMADISSIMENSVLTVAESADKQLLQIIVWSEKIIGSVESTKYADETKEVVLKSSVFKIADSYETSGAPRLNLGDSGTFYMYNNYIAYFEPETDSAYKFGYIIKKGKFEKLDWYYYLKVLTQDGNIENLLLAKKIMLDEVPVRTESGFDSIAEQQLIRYIPNADGDVYKIDTAPEYRDEFRNIDDRDGLWQENEMKQSLKYRSEGKSFEGRFKISDGTLVFAIPETDTENYDEYFVGGINLLTDDKNHKVTAYSVSPKSEYCEALIAYGVSAKNITTNTPIMLVESVAVAIDADDNVTYQITGLFNGKQTSLFTEDKDVLDSMPEKPSPGDIIRFGRDANNVINEVKLYFDYSEQSLTDEVKAPNYTSGARLIYKNVYRKNGNTLFVTGEPVEKLDMKSSDMERVPSTTVYVYEDEKVRIGSVNDVRSYEEYGNDYSKIVYFTVYGLPRTLVVYR